MLGRLTSVARDESLAVQVAGVFAILVLLGLGYFVTVDTWLALTAGRVVAEGGPPDSDTLTAWTLGRDWVDQQWLGQLVLYELWRLGGLALVGLVHAVVLVGTFTAALVLARRRGGSPRHVALIALLAFVPVLVVAGNIRTQTFAFPLFLAIFVLVSGDRRTPSPRVLWCLPLLVAWANVHGSVLVGVGMLALAAALDVLAWTKDRTPPNARAALRGTGLALAAGLALMAGPYGAGVFAYFADLFGNGEIQMIAPEWTATVLTPFFLPVYVLGGLGLVLLGRGRERLTTFEILLFLGVLAGGLLAKRNLAWLGFLALVLLPPLLTAARGWRTPAPSRAAHLATGLVIAGVAVAAVAGPAAVDSHVEERFPAAAARALVREARADPGTPIFVHPRYTDWLLLEHPELAGRLPVDIRFELLTEDEIRRVRRLLGQIGSGWRAAAGGARLFLLDRSEKPLDNLPDTSSVLLTTPGARRLHAGGDLVLVRLP